MVNALHAAQAAGGTPPAPTAPAAPTLTTATAGNGSVALTWTTPADGGSQLTGYEVWRSTTTGSEAFHVAVPVQNGYTDSTNVTNGTTYFYQVKAVNAVGPGPLSNELSATPVAPPPTVTRTGGAVRTFATASGSAGSMTFTLPPGSDRLVALVSLSSVSVRVTEVTWKPDPANPSQDQALTFVGRQISTGSKGSVEIWELADPTPGVAGSGVSHLLSASANRVMGLQALAGVASIGTPVGAGAYARPIEVAVGSEPGALVLDVLYGLNSTTSYTAGAGQEWWWNLSAGFRGAGSMETGAPSVVMSWTAGATTHLALLAVSFNPTP